MVIALYRLYIFNYRFLIGSYIKLNRYKIKINICILWVTNTTQTQLFLTPLFFLHGSDLSSLGRLIMKKEGLMVVVSPVFGKFSGR